MQVERYVPPNHGNLRDSSASQKGGSALFGIELRALASVAAVGTCNERPRATAGQVQLAGAESGVLQFARA